MEAKNLLSCVLPEDEIFISGVSGRLPNSRNMAEFSDNLYNKIDMVDDDERKWRHTNVEIPKRMGKVSNLEKFDASFFGIDFKEAHTLDPQCRCLIEHAYEAVFDAGMNPRMLKGSRTGVFIGACFCESERIWLYERIYADGYGLTGCHRSSMANRISYTMGLTGPSFLVDTACSSSMYALDMAFNSIRNGECDAAFVGGSNLMLHPYVSLQFARLGVLAMDGYCRPFSNDATGYTRSEAICVIYLQKAKDAKRNYCSLLYSKTNCDGYKEEGITYPSGHMQAQLLTEFYNDIGVQPSSVDYVEAHSTGTLVGDPEECLALDKIFCTGRNKPLLVGSIKSNIGHSEGTSGVCSIIKALLAFHTGKIGPNIHFLKPREGVTSLEKGRLKVVTDPTDIEGPLIGVNSFGFGGANAHALLKANNKKKVNNGAPADSLPRLVAWSGRTEEAVETMLNDFITRPLDVEFVALLHNIQSEATPGNVFRGYGIFQHVPGENAVSLAKDIQHYSGLKRPLVWVFSGMGSQWTGMGAALMQIPLFRQSIQRCHDVLATKNIDLINIISSPDETTFDNILHSFVGIAAIQVGLVDILRELEIVPDFIIGHSVGELGCAYADGCFTAEQMVLAAYSRGMASLETKVVKGSMAAIGMGFRKIKSLLPSEIEVACHNGPDSCTISGPCENVTAFVKKLQDDGIFAREVPCSNIAYHSRYIADMGPRLLARLNEVLPAAKARSAKWLSTSVPKIQWDLVESQSSSAHYHTNNLLSPVLFEETSALLPANALTIEIAPHALLQAIIRKSMPKAVHIGLTQRGNKDNSQYLLAALGKLYINGFDIQTQHLYPQVEFPVSNGTPMISPMIRWDHSENWYVTKFEMKKSNSGERKVAVTLYHQDFHYISGHTIDGRILFPATAYLHLAWETLAMTKGPLFFDLEVEFEDVKFLRATPFTKDVEIEFTIIIQPGTGKFEITEGNSAVVTGFIRVLDNVILTDLPPPPESDHTVLETKDFYKELRIRGYHYNGAFRAVEQARSDGVVGKIKWDLNWVAFMDNMLQIQIIGQDSRSLLLPTGIQKLSINPKLHLKIAGALTKESPFYLFDVQYSKELNIIRAGGIEIKGLQASPVGRRKPPGFPVLESYKFIPHLPTPPLKSSDAVRVFVQLALENIPVLKIKAVEVDTVNAEPILPSFQEALGDLPLVTSDLMFLTPQTLELPGIHVEDGKLSTQTNCIFVIGAECLTNTDFMSKVANSLSESGFVVSREKAGLTLEEIEVPSGFQLLIVAPTETDTLVLLQHQKRKFFGSPSIIKIQSNDDQYLWLDEIRTGMKNGPVILVAQKDSLNGLIGLVNCIRKEPDGHLASCVFIDDDKAPEFELEADFFKSHLKLGLAINVFRDGRWGSYRHLQLTEQHEEQKRTDHCYANVLTRGDLSSFTWLLGPYNFSRPKGELVRLKFASLNFRDVMIATGKLAVEVFTRNRLEQECVLGLEYSGISDRGRRIMGMVPSGALATHIEADDTLLWECPPHWTLEEAATVPVVYGTVYFAYFVVGRISRGKSILIHAGSGGVGLAAIRVALAYGMEVFTTVSTQEKRDFLTETFPTLKAENIGNSRDISFEAMVMTQTRSKGVDFVLNSLADEKLQASIRCLGKGGKFLEIGKFDMANDTKIGLRHFLKEISFNAVLVDNLFQAPKEEKEVLRAMIDKDIRAGIIKPLKTTIFPANEVEQAFRFLASGKHIGKVLLQIRASEHDDHTVPIIVTTRPYCNADQSYVIPGGLGGFGLELADWLVIRGCRKLVLSSSRGITKQYQAYRIKIWETYGCKVLVNTDDITTNAGCEALIRAASKLGSVGGIFNLAVSLRDAIMENQDQTKFQECMAPKAIATKHLDSVSRKLCPNLQYFVVFSSVSCGRGNAGQTNYGMANSVMERLIEQRYAQGFPAKAVQWGAVGEVGLVADMQEDKLDMEIGGTLQQRISSCLQELDPLLGYADPIVSSMVVAEKRVRSTGKGNILETVMNIMSIRDIKSVSMDTTLSELGMDSLMAVEIKQTLEREFELVLSPQELRSLTFQKLQEFAENRETAAASNIKIEVANNATSTGMSMMLRNLGDEANSHHTVLRLKSLNNDKDYKSCALITPGVEGVVGNAWHFIGGQLSMPAFVLQLTKTIECLTITEIVQEVIESVNEIFKHVEFFYLVGYSFGSIVTLELARILEATGKRGQIVLIDGAPLFLKKLTLEQLTDKYTAESLQLTVMAGIIRLIVPEDNSEMIRHIAKCSTWDERIQAFLELSKVQNVYSENYIKDMITAMYRRTRIALEIDTDNVEPLKSTITLIRPTEVSVTDIAEDYELSRYSVNPVVVKFIEGNHATILENPKLRQIINEAGV